MRSALWARWATCALAISIGIPAFPAFGGDKRKSLADCTSFDQADKGDDGVQFTIHNTCTIPVDCAITWNLVCAPDSHKRRAVHANTSKLSLTVGGAESADATTSTCGDAGWTIQDVQWSCQVAKD